MKYLLLTLLFSLVLTAQNNAKNFLVNGKTNIKTENVWLLQPFGKDFSIFELSTGNQINVDSKGNFSFRGDLKNPTFFLLATDNDVSEGFFLENNTSQKITYTEDNAAKSINLKVIGSAANEEYQRLKAKLEEAFVKDMLGNTKINKGVEDYIVYNHIKQNPDSYVGLWLLIKDFSDNHPNRYQTKALPLFSKSVQTTDLFKNFQKKIEEVEGFRSSIKKGITLKNRELKDEAIILSGENKYILLDFWFSHCAPCLAEMPNYMTVYEKYKGRNFDIIGISTDKEKDLKNWENKIETLNIAWKNYWDDKSVFTRKMNVFKFPSNFLLDGEGNVIYQDITASELDLFLAEKLKSVTK